MKNGIAIAGTLLVDKINVIKKYPNSGELTQIYSVSKSVGGCLPNVGIDLKKIDKDIRILGIGKVGEDDDGNYLKETLSQNGVETSGIKSGEGITSFTEVMSIEGGERTFFTCAGACADFGFDDFDFTAFDVKMLHLGYFLLLEKVDNGDGEKILKKAKELGITTSIDLVSENSDRYKKVLPCLKYVDNLIINEIEAGNLVNIKPTDESIQTIAEKIKLLGVSERIIIHKPEYSVCLSNEGFVKMPSFNLPKGFIKGSTGAGDAFCAGALYGIYNEYSNNEILSFASQCAVCALSAQDATSGLKSKADAEAFCSKYARKEI